MAQQITIGTSAGNITCLSNISVAPYATTSCSAVTANTALGVQAAIANVSITGGTSGQTIITDGTGNLSFATAYANSNVATYLASNTDPTISSLVGNTTSQQAALAALTASTTGITSTVSAQGTAIGNLNVAVNNLNTNVVSLQNEVYSNTTAAAWISTYAGNITAATICATVIQAPQPHITTLGNLTGMSSSGNVRVCGSIQSNTQVSAPLISATGSVKGGNLVAANNVSVGGNVSAGGNVNTNGLVANTASFVGNVQANYFYGNYLFGNGGGITGLYGNSCVAAYLKVYNGSILAGAITATGAVVSCGSITTGSSISASGSIRGASLSAAGNVTGNNLIINNDAIIQGNLSVAGNVTFTNSNVVVTNDLYIALANNKTNFAGVDGAGITAGINGGNPVVTWLYNATANAWTSDVAITAVGNIYGNYIKGNGAFLTGISSPYSNANVAAYLPTYTGAVGNINTDVANLQTNVVTLTTGLSSTTSNVANLTFTVANTTANVTSLTGALANTNSNVANNLNNITTLQGNVVSLTSAVTTLQGNVVSLTGAIAATNSALANNASNITILQGNVASLSGNIYGNATAAAYFANATSNILTSGNITGNRITGNLFSTTGNIYAGNSFVTNLTITNAIAANVTTTTVSASNLVLNSTSSQFQRLTGSGTSNVILPNQTTIPAGTAYVIDNDSAGTVFIFDSGNNVLATAANGAAGYFYSMSNVTAAGNWGGYGFLPDNIYWSQNLLNMNGVPISNAGNVSAGNITGNSFATPGAVTATTVSTTGNIQGQYILGNGSQLTGIITTVSNISNGTSNVTFSGVNGNILMVNNGNTVVTVTPTAVQTNILQANVISSYGTVNNVQVTGGNIALTPVGGQGANFVFTSTQLQVFNANITAGNGDVLTSNGGLHSWAPLQSGAFNFRSGAAALDVSAANVARLSSANNAIGLYTNGLGNVAVATFSPAAITLTGNTVNVFGNTNFANNVNITGNLSVAGNITFTSSNVVITNDLYIDLANNQSTLAGVNGAGIQAGNTGTTPLITYQYNTVANAWATNVGITAAGNVSGNNIVANTLYANNLSLNIGISLTGNASYGNTLINGLESIVGNVYVGGNSLLSGNVYASRNVFTAGFESVAGNIYAGNTFITGNENVTGNVSAAGNVYAGNTFITGNENVTGNVSVAGNVYAGFISAFGIIQAAQFFGNGSQLSNVNAATVGTLGNLTVTGNINTGNISLSGNVTSNNIILQNAANSNIYAKFQTSYLGGNNGGLYSFTNPTGNTYVQLIDQGTVGIGVRCALYAFQPGNLTAPGNISAVGNITGSYVLGNGAFLTGLPASYSNANVTTFLANTTANITTTGNIAAGNISASGNINSAGNINLTNNATIGGTANITGNINANGVVSAAGNVRTGVGSSFIAFGAAATGYGGLYTGPGGYTTLPSTTIQVTSNGNTYAQMNMQNLNTGTAATSEYVATAVNGTDTTFFVDMGIAGNNYSNVNPVNSLGTSLAPNDAYVYTQGSGNVGNLIIGTNAGNTAIKFIASGSNTANIVATMTPGNLTVNAACGANSYGNINGGYLYLTQRSGVGGEAHVQTLYAVQASIGGLVQTVANSQYVQQYLPSGYVSAAGNIYGNGILSVLGNVTSSGVFIGNGAGLTGINSSNANTSITLYALGSGSLSGNVGNIGHINFALNNATGTTIQAGNIAANSIAIGANSAAGPGSIAIGSYQGGQCGQKALAVALGASAGLRGQGQQTVAIGYAAGAYCQGQSAMAIGPCTATLCQGGGAIALGYLAGQSHQGSCSIAIGQGAGRSYQGQYSVAIGQGTAVSGQQANAVAIGVGAGYSAQRNNAVAIGACAGHIQQGSNSVAIGTLAGYAQGNNSIILNATGSQLNGCSNNCAFYVAPIRANTTGNMMYYNTITKEVSYGPFSLGANLSITGNVYSNSVSTTGNIISGAYISASGAVYANASSTIAFVSGPGAQSNVALLIQPPACTSTPANQAIRDLSVANTNVYFDAGMGGANTGHTFWWRGSNSYTNYAVLKQNGFQNLNVASWGSTPQYWWRGALTTDVTMTSGTDNTIYWNSLNDPNGWGPSSGKIAPGRIGWYQVMLKVNVSGISSSNQINTQIRVNGTNKSIAVTTNNSNNISTIVNSTMLYIANTGDYFTATVYPAGSSQVLQSGDQGCVMTVVWISP